MHMVGRNQIYTANARHFWGEITDYTVVYGVHIQFWPTLLIHVTHFTHVAHFTHIAHFTHVADCTILISVFSAGTVCLHHSGQLFHIRCSFHARCWLHISYFCVQCRYSLISVFISYFCVQCRYGVFAPFTSACTHGLAHLTVLEQRACTMCMYSSGWPLDKAKHTAFFTLLKM